MYDTSFSMNIHGDTATADYRSTDYSGWLNLRFDGSHIAVHITRQKARDLAYQILDSLDEWDEATVDAGYAHDV